MRFDFHVHSIHSDGTLSVRELAALSVEKGIDGFALTDHDTIEGWYQIPVAEKEYGITILPAVEISTEWQNRDVHILGFGIPIHSQSFQKFLKILCDERITRVRKIIQKVNDLGMFLSFEEVKRQSNGSLGRPHVAAAMAEKGYVKDVGEAFAKYLNRGKKCYVPRSHVSPMEAVDEVVQSGGAAVLAHPGIDQAYQVLEDLVDHGLKGIEVYHSSHHPGMETKFIRMAKEFGLFVSAGSDFHRLEDDSHGMLGTKTLDWEHMGSYYRHFIMERKKDMGANV